jgi:thiamine-monophosphate kinase
MVSSFGEFDLIDVLRRRRRVDGRVPLGIGDDAAVIVGPAEGQWLVAADMLLEGRHFERGSTTARLIGRKALAVNLSDIAAMAGCPVAAFVTVAHRRGDGVEFALEVHAGLGELADEWGVVVAGGDTNLWEGGLVISVTVLGEPTGNRAVTRRGAQPGDRIFVTGALGGSLASGRHLTFPPRLAEAQTLHAAVELHAMIDISDGLLADLGHICRESGVGAILAAERIPLAVPPVVEARRRLEQALTDGEDFELAFCVGEADAARLRRDPPVPVYEVGEIVTGADVCVVDARGDALSFASRGWEHRW